MKVSIQLATVRDASFIVANMREPDRRELLPLMPPDITATEMVDAGFGTGGGEAFVALYGDEPAAVFGFTPATPAGNVLSAWAFGTRRMWRVIPAITRFVAVDLLPHWERDGVTRMECRALASNLLAMRWFEATGAHEECLVPGYGRANETYVQFAWTMTSWRIVRDRLRLLHRSLRVDQ